MQNSHFANFMFFMKIIMRTAVFVWLSDLIISPYFGVPSLWMLKTQAGVPHPPNVDTGVQVLALWWIFGGIGFHVLLGILDCYRKKRGVLNMFTETYVERLSKYHRQ